jgi:tight adherence protein C
MPFDILDPVTLIIILASAGSFMTILAFGMPLLARDNFSSRLRAVAKRREELQAQQKARNGPRASRLRQQQSEGTVKLVVERLKLLNPASSQAMRLRLTQAGMRGPAPLYTYAFFRFVAPIALILLTAIYVFGLAKLDMGIGGKLMICVAAGLIGFFLPGIILSNKITNRQILLTRQFPDALDLMVICVEAGLSMEAAFNRVADELADSSPELCEEFALTTAELAFLPDRRAALENLATRTGLPATKSLATSLIQAEKYGTPISVSLRVLSTEQREERMSRAERKAGALPAQLTVPMIAFFLPVLFVVLIGPAIIRTMETFGNR